MKPIVKMNLFFISMTILLSLMAIILWDVQSARADGEEPFIARILEIGTNSMSVIITERIEPYWERWQTGRKVTLMITENTFFKNKAFKDVTQEFFSQGDVIRVQPVTNSKGEVEASLIRLVRR